MTTWLFVVSCAGLGSAFLYMAYGALQESAQEDAEGVSEVAGSLLSSAVTLGAFGALLWVLSVGLAGITLLHY